MKTIALLLSAALGLPLFAQDNWDRVLPEDTLGVARLENAGDLAAAFRKTGLGKILEDPGLKAFLRSIQTRDGGFEDALKDVDAFFKKLDAAFGGSLEGGLSSIGRLEVAALPPAQEGRLPVFVISAELKKPELEASLRRALKEDVFKGKEVKTVSIEGAEAQRFGEDMHLAKLGSALVLCRQPEGIALIARRLAAPPARGLADNERYIHARKTLEAGGKGFFLFADLESIFRVWLPPEKSLELRQRQMMWGLEATKYTAMAVDGDGDFLLQRTHVNGDLASPAPAPLRELLDMPAAKLARLPGVRSAEQNGLRSGGLLKDVFERLRPHFAMFSEELGKEGIGIDFSKFPVETLARHMGEGQDVTLVDGRGMTLVSRSPSGIACSPFLVAEIGVVAAIAIPGLLSSQRASNERNASASLKSLATAEADFRANDRDGNKVNDFWTGDVAGLYCLTNAGEPIKLIDASIAAADSAPLEAGGEHAAMTNFATMGPKSGYFFRAIPHYQEEPDGKEIPYNNATKRNASRFGFCAYPAQYESSGRVTFILNEGNSMWAKDTQGRPVGVFPADPSAEGWRPMN